MKVKRILSIILMISIIATSFSSVVQASAQTEEWNSSQVTASKDGSAQTASRPSEPTEEFIISNEYDFVTFMTKPELCRSNYKITLACDIDMKGKAFKPIKEFGGKFDGCGHTVSNLKIQDKHKLFKKFDIEFINTLDSSAEFKNVTFDNYTIEDKGSSSILTKTDKSAGFVLTNHGTISGVDIKNGKIINVNNTYKFLAWDYGDAVGFVLNNEKDGIIKNCFVDISSKKSGIESGFVYRNFGKIIGSGTNLSVNFVYENVGGFVTENYGTIEYCNYKGEIDIQSGYCVGGFCGKNLGNISFCKLEGAVNSASIPTGGAGAVGVVEGGFVGENNGIIRHSSSKGEIIGYKCVGSFCGNNTGEISDSKAEGSAAISTRNGEIVSCGGFVGKNSGAVKDCISTGSVTGEEYVGGFCGENKGDISKCKAEGNAKASTKVNTNRCGGFVGENSGKVNDCRSTGSATGEEYAGGFVGLNKSEINGCNAYGKAIAKTEINTARAGGFVGENEKGLITKCKAIGGSYSWSEYGQAKAGGFVGVNKATITNSKASRYVYLTSGTFCKDDGCGGFVGKNGQGGSIDGCYAEAIVETTNKKKGGSFVGEALNKSTINNSKCKTKIITKSGIRKQTKFYEHKDKKALIENCYAN